MVVKNMKKEFLVSFILVWCGVNGNWLIMGIVPFFYFLFTNAAEPVQFLLNTMSDNNTRKYCIFIGDLLFSIAYRIKLFYGTKLVKMYVIPRKSNYNII